MHPFSLTDHNTHLSIILSPWLTGSRNPRLGAAIFGMGFGCGDAFRVSNYEFEKEKASAAAIAPKKSA